MSVTSFPPGVLTGRQMEAYNCSFCQGTGHNRRTCLAAEIAGCLLPCGPIQSTPAPSQRKTHCCRTCDESGHNSQNCPKRTSPSVKGIRICSGCGESGHNVRTCPVMNLLSFLCTPCETTPISGQTYKRKVDSETNTIKEYHIPTETLSDNVPSATQLIWT